MRCKYAYLYLHVFTLKDILWKGRVVLEEMISLNRDELLLRQINTEESYWTGDGLCSKGIISF